ncbi:hypothetical protein OQA88_5694 [Cercophora sp. LCS_1]
MAPDLALYAELLSNIRQVTLAASLPSPSDASTRVTLAANGTAVELAHQGATQRLTLPAKASLGAVNLPLPKQPAATLSWRLALSPGILPHTQSSEQSTALWSATDLEDTPWVSCRACKASVVNARSLVWKDLPSENWAEMMEFWHCHKPDGHHHHENGHGGTGKADESSLAARGYGASSAISSQKGIGFVDLTTLLFHETDCSGITYSCSTFENGSLNRHDLMETQSRSLNVFCSSCQSQLGFYNFRTVAVTLLKWQVSCEAKSGAVPGTPECLAATLISTIARSASSKSLITPFADNRNESDQVIHIWVLNSSIIYSSSAVTDAVPAIKLLYRLIRREEADRMLGDLNCDSQEINLPLEAINGVVSHLDAANLLLPSTERSMKGWKVGLLAR